MGDRGRGRLVEKVWYGVKRFFAWLETRAYKMHVRVLLSRYRAYTPCAACGGARLQARGAAVASGQRRARAADARRGAALPPAGVEWRPARSRRCPACASTI